MQSDIQSSICSVLEETLQQQSHGVTEHELLERVQQKGELIFAKTFKEIF